MKRKYTVTTNEAETTKLLRNAIDGYMRGAYIEPVYNINYMNDKAGLTIEYASSMDLTEVFDRITNPYLLKKPEAIANSKLTDDEVKEAVNYYSNNII
ncbi:hypothetical protein SPSF3K_00704 [Streptococcus parauberis]|uniref:hypothetical protein n=1 Tax=Streptococcus parauberis TaxID=1348 RepID=UPI00056127E3|nr:hypothetical protein [Streptococcus parauberis]AUT05431.1 hypothetical protein SPSF3K_00704 [Streptococcus parauberis]UWV10877.1 hypothetical protein N2A95_03545 [Streptococcus parauberis]WEM60915.1 hypothetical protein P1T46_07260 [Streptococcus parauberis]WEM65556.1 hypothetical protein P1T45_02695 [Streptococcus parauberis]WOF47427.1 hypothetical protein K7G42_02630 [Streptococcus parauberis]